MNVICGVNGSLSHCHAPTAVQIVVKTKIILHRIVAGRRHVITSVSRLSNAFKSIDKQKLG